MGGADFWEGYVADIILLFIILSPNLTSSVFEQ